MAERHTFIMRAGIYTDALGRIEGWAGKASWRRISLSFDLRSWASEEVGQSFFTERGTHAKAQRSCVHSFVIFIPLTGMH